MLVKGKYLRRAKRYDRQGNIKARDEIVHYSVPLWARYVVKQCPGEVEVIGKEKIPQDQAVVFIANHQSNMDIPVLLGYIDKLMTFVAKVELEKIPLLADWMKMLQCTFMNRKSPRASVKAMHEAVDGLKKGYSQMIFPEGTRSRGGPHHEFKAGSFKLAFLAEATIVPVTIDGTWHMLEEHGVMSKGKAKVIIHDPIVTAGMTKEQMRALPPIVEKICCDPLPPPRELPLKKKGLF